MTWIGGILSKSNASQDELGRKLVVMMEAGCPAAESSTAACHHCVEFVVDGMHGQALAQASIPIEGTTPEHVYTDYREKPALVYDGHLYDVGSTGSRLSRVRHTSNKTVAQSLAHLLVELPGDLLQKARRALASVDGNYALAIGDSDQMVISRDPSGTKPLYFAENDEFCAFASNKKPLWRIGLGEVKPLRAGMLAVLNREGVSVKKAPTLREKAIDIKNMSQAVNAYEQALCSAVRKTLAEVNYIDKVGVLLSGGVDSCVITKLVCDAAPDLGIETIAYGVGLPASPDVDFALEFAGQSGIRHEMRILSISDVEQYIPKVIEAIEDADFVQVETGIGLYAAIDMASRDGTRVVFSGQGPDELWGGYSWYPRVLGKDSRRELCRRMREDLTRVDIETLDRENKIALAHRVELFFPYLDRQIVNVAMSVASELKVPCEEDRLGKQPHRQLAMRIGIPEKYANREKLAIQHGTGIHNVLDDIARRNGFDPALVKSIGYKSEEVSTEKMGSSARYGYRYAERRLWQVPQHVQLFFHSIAYKQGLLDKSVRDRVAYFLEKARLAYRVSV